MSFLCECYYGFAAHSQNCLEKRSIHGLQCSDASLTGGDYELQVQNAIEAGNAKAAMAKQSTGGLTQRQVQELESVQLAAQANALAEMEQAHNASQRQLLAELDYLRQQKAAAEERSIRADHIVSSHFQCLVFMRRCEKTVGCPDNILIVVMSTSTRRFSESFPIFDCPGKFEGVST